MMFIRKFNKPLVPAAVIIFFLFFAACSREKSVWIPSWRGTSPLTIKRSGAAAVVHNSYIYVIGGVDGKNFLPTTEFTKINKDGSLEPWRAGPQMNEPRGFTDAVIYNGSIYVIGGGKGLHGKILLRSVERAHIKPDGSLSPWEKEKYSMSMARRCSKAVIDNGRIVSLGGFGGDMLDTVEHADILEDGSVGEWFEEGETMTTLRYINGVKKAGEITYVIGGHHQTQGVGISDVEWSKIVDWAGYKKWEKTTPLQVGRYGLSTALYKQYLYTAGGITGVEYLDSIEKSEIVGEGQLAPWKFTTPLARPRAMFNMVVYQDWIYVLGGTNRDGYLNSVEYATFDEKGDIGFWGTQKEHTAFIEKAKSTDNKHKFKLSNEGIVIDVLQASRYTYLLINKKGRKEWVAAPKLEINAGAKVRYGKGVYMSNFYSKELKQNFPSVIFTGKIEKVDEK